MPTIGEGARVLDVVSLGDFATFSTDFTETTGGVGGVEAFLAANSTSMIEIPICNMLRSLLSC